MPLEYPPKIKDPNLQLWIDRLIFSLEEEVVTKSAFSATLSAHQVLSGATTNVTAQFNTEIFDINGDFNASTYTFTAPVSGYYQMNVVLRIDKMRTESNISWYSVYLVTGNRTYSSTFDIVPLQSLPDYSFGYTFNMNVLADLDVNDTALVQVRQEGGSISLTNVRTESWFSGYYVTNM